MMIVFKQVSQMLDSSNKQTTVVILSTILRFKLEKDKNTYLIQSS